MKNDARTTEAPVDVATFRNEKRAIAYADAFNPERAEEGFDPLCVEYRGNRTWAVVDSDPWGNA